MRKGLLLCLFILLAACRPEPEFAPSPLDRNDTAIAEATLNAVATFNAIATLQALPTQTLPPTRVSANTRPRITPTPTIDYEYVISSHAPGPWRTAFFTDSEGNRHTLEAFEGQVVIIQTFGSICQPCAEQTDDIKLTIEQLNSFGNIQQAVFLILSIDATDTQEILKEYDAAHRPAGLVEGQTWITGVASQELIRNLRDTFGEDTIDPYRGGILVVDRDGLGHLLANSFVSYQQLRDVLQYFVNYGITDDATEVPEDATQVSG